MRRERLSLKSYDKLVKLRYKQMKTLKCNPGLISQTDDVYFDKQISIDHFSYVFHSGKMQALLKVLSSEKRLVIFADDFAELDLFLFNTLSKISLDQLYIFVKSNPIITEPSINDFQLKRPWGQKTAVHIELCSSKNAGFDLREDSLKEKLGPHIIEKTPIVVLGEYSTLTFEGALFEYSVICPVRGDKACKYIGMLPSFEKEDEVKLFIKDIKAEWPYDFKKSFSGVERSTFNLISEVEKDKDLYMNLYSDTYQKKDFPSFFIKSDSWEEITREREKRLETFINVQGKGVVYSDKVYQTEDKEKIRVNTLRFKAGQISPKVYLAQDFDQGLIDIREFSKGLETESPIYFINFLYFATGKLRAFHDSRRDEHEKLKGRDFYIDAIYDSRSDISTFPLYNKAYVALKKDGTLDFGRQCLKGGRVKINEIEFVWDEKDVNPPDDQHEVIVYTPHLSKLDIFKVAPDNREHSLIVGKDRLNLLIVNDRVVSVKKGEISLSPFGVILSLSKMAERLLIKQLRLSPTESGYFMLPEDLKVSLTIPENDDYIWKYCGANLLVKDGKNLMLDEESAQAEFYMEGWYDPLSKQTQETQVQEWSRGPRSVLGIDTDGSPFVAVFSGRTSESAGARFDEINMILTDQFGSIKDAINLDGGASSCLGMIYKKEFFELSLPCCTGFTTTGMARAVNSFMLF